MRNDLDRWPPPVKWLLAIPHYVVLFFLYIAVFFVTQQALAAVVGCLSFGADGVGVGCCKWPMHPDPSLAAACAVA